MYILTIKENYYDIKLRFKNAKEAGEFIDEVEERKTSNLKYTIEWYPENADMDE